MLKRFMNWLLKRVQSLLGAKSGRRSSSSRAAEASSTLRDRINHLSQQTRQVDPNRQIDPLDSAIPFAERAPLMVSTEPLPEPADEPSNSAEDRVEPIAAAEKKIGKLTDFDANTHRHLDVAATALSDDISVKPAFPTEISELIGSPSSDDTSTANESANGNASESISANLPLRSLKKVSDDQLPAIHDLLPAIEPSADELVSSPFAHSSLASKQAVLFSFDIVESEEPIAESPFFVEQSSSVVSSDTSSNAYSESEPSDTESEISEAISEAIKDRCATKRLVPSAQILTDDEVPSNLPETISVLQPAEELAEPTANAEALPYPWLLTAPESESYIESEAQEVSFESAKAALSDSAFAGTSQALSSDSQLAEAAEERSVKNGVVKLLFTLKEGNFHGYVAPDDGTKDILFHQKYINADIFSQLERGAKVAASVKYVEGKAYATHVKLL